METVYSKTELLNKLFDEWVFAHSQETYESCLKTMSNNDLDKSSFEKDGIISEIEYDNESLKVLFIASEANVKFKQVRNDKYLHKDDYRDRFVDYYKSGYDEWKGKMRERLSAIYGFITKQNDVPFHLLANKFAIIDLNKRGGNKNSGKGKHIVEYVKEYRNYILKEIEIINPDIIAWIGVKTYSLKIPEILGTYVNDNKKYLVVNSKRIPILSLWHTSYYQSRIEPIPGYDYKIIGRQCARAKLEMDKYILNESYIIY